ncbi:MAG: HAMP domain-containing sensor histidine kinase [Bacillota bacterium]|nr:hypothetical protein [Bacillota bacterium]
MNEYTLRAFLRDRLPYILFYAAFGLSSAAVVQLDLTLQGASLQFANVAYLVLLGFAGLVAFLLVDYRRQAPFYQRLARVGRDATPEEMSILETPRTLEQRVYADAWATLFARLQTEFAGERVRTQQRLHFLSQWAHHMKTPVAVIDLELQKARRDGLADPEAFIASIAEEIDRIQRSLQALLNAIRLDQFAADLKLEPVHLPSLARQVVNDYRRAFIAHRVFPRLEPAGPDVPEERLTVHSDAKWLRLVLEQIIGNAVKYAARPEGDGHVTIRFALEEGDTVLEVEDDGIGIPPEDLGRVCEPFFTGAAGRAYPGSTGLGLYLAREICRRLGHRLTIDSQPGRGTCVRIRFARDPSIYAPLRDALTRPRRTAVAPS